VRRWGCCRRTERSTSIASGTDYTLNLERYPEPLAFKDSMAMAEV